MASTLTKDQIVSKINEKGEIKAELINGVVIFRCHTVDKSLSKDFKRRAEEALKDVGYDKSWGILGEGADSSDTETVEADTETVSDDTAATAQVIPSEVEDTENTGHVRTENIDKDKQEEPFPLHIDQNGQISLFS